MESRDTDEDAVSFRQSSNSGSPLTGSMDDSVGTNKRVKFSDIDEVSSFEVSSEDQHSTTRMYSRDTLPWSERMCSCYFYLHCIANRLPILEWLPKYECKKYIVNDIVSGVTIAVLHIPQGLAYAHLGNVPAIVGIYMAFFPVIVYFFFGTSRHVSIGTFAVVCLMTGHVVNAHTSKNQQGAVNAARRTSASPIEVATAVTFMVAITQLAMYFCHLSAISMFLSKTCVSGFIAGAAVHVLTSQVKEIFGLRLNVRHGPLKILYSYVDIVSNITSTNYIALLLALCTITILVLNNIYIKPRLMKRFGLPLPMELFVIVISTGISALVDLPERFNISHLQHVPTGFPTPRAPNFSLLTAVLWDSLVIALVSYCITISMAFILASKLNYQVDPHQELLALALANLCGSFFLCLPVASSLSRSLVQEAAGGQTQLASLVSCFILMVVLLYVGPLLEPLPRAVLAAIIVVALGSVARQVSLLQRAWRLSRLDGAVWLATFLAVVAIDIGIGLACGVFITLASTLVHGARPYTCLLGRVPMGAHPAFSYIVLKHEIASEVPGVKIIKVYGSLNFATKDYIKQKIYQLSGVNPLQVSRLIKQIETSEGNVDELLEKKENIMKVVFKLGNTVSKDSITLRRSRIKLTHVIVDLTVCGEHDYTGTDALTSLVTDYEQIGVGVVVVSYNVRLSSFSSVRLAVEHVGGGAMTETLLETHSLDEERAETSSSQTNL